MSLRIKYIIWKMINALIVCDIFIQFSWFYLKKKQDLVTMGTNSI